MKPAVSIRTALSDPALLGSTLAGDTWQAHRVILISAMGEELTAVERQLFKQLTGRDREPGERVDELVEVIGRRGGKSRSIATLAVYIAALCKHNLVPGERGVLLCISPDQRTASIILEYAAAIFEQSPVLKHLVKNRTADTLELSDVTIEVRAANFRRLRGPTYVAVLVDEGAWLYSDDSNSANPDTEILNAVRPGLATTGGLLCLISSPYAKRGEVWEAFKRHYGPAGDPRILVAQGESRLFNPSLPQSVVDRALERDRPAAEAEYLAIFRQDIENFLSKEAVQACVDNGVSERPPARGVDYFSFTDGSGGSGGDSSVVGIGHMEDEILVVDAMRERRSPHDPDSFTEEAAQLLAQYSINKTVGDRYSAMWIVQAFEKRNCKYEHSEQSKSQLYLELVPRVNAKTIRLLDHPRTINQISLLERRTGRTGRDTISHPPNLHDDLANVVAGLCGLASGRSTFDSSYKWVGPISEPDKQNGQRSLWSHPIFGLNIYG